ncbi:MAG: hypothetical protein GC193_03460 [Cryomorphaceae bacterium]|nr:hypothetical protein [Cryomorphaceae bacterium]
MERIWKVGYVLAILFLAISCKKMEERSALLLEVKSFNGIAVADGGPYPTEVVTGQEIVIEYYFESTVPLEIFTCGTDREADQSEYLLEGPAEGDLSGIVRFKFVVDDLLPGEPAGVLGPYVLMRMELMNEEGVVASRNISFRKVS